MPDYIPASDTDFLAWAQNFATYAEDHMGPLGLIAADVAPITAALGGYGSAMASNVTLQNSARAARIDKDDKRSALEAAIRKIRNCSCVFSRFAFPYTPLTILDVGDDRMDSALQDFVFEADHSVQITKGD
jgi:hypothetical protein